MKVIIDIDPTELDWSRCSVNREVETIEFWGLKSANEFYDYEIDIYLDGSPVDPLDEEEAMIELLTREGFA